MAYTKAQLDSFKEIIVNEISIGKSLRSIVLEHKLPALNTILYWLNPEHNSYDPLFAKQYASAREKQADYYADEIIEIADGEDDPAKARVRIDARKWKASKMKPKVYGDRVINENENKNYNIDLTDAELDKKIEALKKHLSE